MKTTGRAFLASFLVAICSLIYSRLDADSGLSAGNAFRTDSSEAISQVWGKEDHAISTEPARASMVYPIDDGLFRSRTEDAARCFGYGGKVLLIVQQSLYDSIATRLTIYREDLEREGYTVQIHKWSGGTEVTFREFLIANKDDLVGAVLIGELPVPWYEYWYPSTYPWCDDDALHLSPYDLPYMDLDGTWYDKDNDGYWDSADPHSPLNADIWIGRLCAAYLDSVSQSSTINDYLYRNHQYRLGNTVRDSKGLLFVNFGSQWGAMPCENVQWLHDILQSLYDTVACVDSIGTGGSGNNKSAYLDSIGSPYEYVFIYAHGAGSDTVGHWFQETNEHVSSYDIFHAGSKVLFVHNYSCSGARWTERNCISNYYIFGNQSNTTAGLVVWGVTVSESFHGNTDFYPALAQGRTFGDALKGHFQEWEGLPCDSACYDSATGLYGDTCFLRPWDAEVLLGDPTLRPRKKIWHVNAAGTGNTPTIQAAIDGAKSYDMIQLAAGTYVGEGNKNLDFRGKPITITAETDSFAVTIDCQNDGRGFYFHSGEDIRSMLVGVTIKNGTVSGSGGGILCDSGSSPRILDCLFLNNAAVSGGAIALIDSSRAVIEGCTVLFGSANVGGGIFLAQAKATIERTIVAFSRSGGGICSPSPAAPNVSCCDLYGNDPCYSLSRGLESGNNISLNPTFCDTANNDWRLDALSPCAPNNNPCHVWIGCRRSGCSKLVRGDANGDGWIDVSDAVYLIGHIFTGGPAPSVPTVGDVNCDGAVDISDVVHLIGYIFSGGPAPCAI